MPAHRKNYTVLVAFPKGGGHWANKGEKLDLMDVEAQQLLRAGRIKLTATETEAEAPAAAATKKTAAKE
ncbi:hypothetical protein IEG05_19680 [Pseudomonas kunmingensis]|uniref:hypothetical protein n=1 Tax=Stutzerimonas kunmingensis TaxID=1211807 RepID=UPI0017474FE8|nr:hypothetical protein [Stutzerimonas kunmingensis]MBD3877430.1 hypothetical protein [Stutzerimonas kunmingensis]